MGNKKTKRKTHAPRRAVASILKTGPRKLELATPSATLKLDLACGQNCKEGYDGVDLPGTGAKHEINLLRFPWPFETNSVIELHCSHFIEHIPMEFVDENGNYVPCGTPGAKDLFFRFFEECHRILHPEGWLEIACPNARCNRAFQDPTHRRFIVFETFSYLSASWRKSMKLDHYATDVDFDGTVNAIVLEDMNARAPEVQQRMFNESWNVILDWQAKLKAIKKDQPGSFVGL